jgi:hypothetical protein
MGASAPSFQRSLTGFFERNHWAQLEKEYANGQGKRFHHRSILGCHEDGNL